ncbi:MAG: hypothetical protein PHY14_03990 [Candidatus Gracilibacteria bacterium]|nr:hypothetical protein [Candidatus Gracilibacteria bacterium]
MGTEKGKWDLGGFAPPKKNNTNSRYWPLGWKPGQLDTVGNTTGKVDTVGNTTGKVDTVGNTTGKVDTLLSKKEDPGNKKRK